MLLAAVLRLIYFARLYPSYPSITSLEMVLSKSSRWTVNVLLSASPKSGEYAYMISFLAAVITRSTRSFCKAS
jgi:hypothetical protein